ncbi:MAG: hypothetical protein AUK03_05820 [Anaerolineae bacterium CG2_30_64_16]|nr:MAG: hypothetical protein AUK03_05820 [Anaerolineae bacterium CG2_30_64_16]
MIARSIYRLSWIGLGALILVSALGALAAANLVAGSGIATLTIPITANQLKPPECDGLDLSNVIVGDADFKDGNANSLLLGNAVANTISAGKGTDCVLSGDGADTLKGEGKDDVLLGGPGDDHIDGGAGWDICYGGPGNDTFSKCEVTVQ